MFLFRPSSGGRRLDAFQQHKRPAVPLLHPSTTCSYVAEKEYTGGCDGGENLLFSIRSCYVGTTNMSDRSGSCDRSCDRGRIGIANTTGVIIVIDAILGCAQGSPHTERFTVTHFIAPRH